MDCKGLKGEELKKCQEKKEKKRKSPSEMMETIESNRKIRQNKREEQAVLRKAKRDARRSKRIQYSQSKNPIGLGTVTKIPRLK
ncbi:MAG: hypothetical protein GY861_02305 [bacterium]|nr:hypothetical protein [bacterium]